MIRAVLARAVAGLGAALARLEPRHWVAVAGSAALHLAVLLGLSQAPPPTQPPLTFEVKLEPPPAAKLPRQRLAKAKAVNTKSHLVRKKPAKHRVREPHTLQAQWKGERKAAKDAPAVTLPDAHALGIAFAKPVAAPGTLAKAASDTVPQAAKHVAAGSALSEPGGVAGSASGGDPGIALATAQQLEQALSASSAGAQGSETPGGSAAASGSKLAAAILSSATASRGVKGGESPQAGELSAQSHGALASGEPSGVRLSLSGVLSSLAAPMAPPAGSLAGTQFSGASGNSMAAAGLGSQSTLAAAASSGPPASSAAANRGDAGAAETSAASDRGVAAHGDSASAKLASADPSRVAPGAKPGAGQGESGASEGGNAGVGAVSAPGASKITLAGASPGRASTPRKQGLAEVASGATSSLAGKGSSGASSLATASGQGAALSGQAAAGPGFSSAKNGFAALSPGEPGSAPRLALAMPVVPAILEFRSGGARSSFRAQGGEAGGASPRAAALAQAGAAALPLPGRGPELPGFSASARPVSLGGGGSNPKGAGKLRSEKVAAVEQIRPDSQVRPLDVLAPSTYCPLPGHVMPDNRPRDTTQDITEKPAYGSDNPSFVFPIRAWAYGHQGRVTVRVQILADGTPGQMWIKQSSGSGILDTDAREQLSRYHFKPARKNGQPVAAWIDVPVDYRLNAESKP